MCQNAASVAESKEDANTLAAAVAVLREGFVRQLDETVLASRSIAELIQRVDPDFGEYLTGQDFERFRRGRGWQANRFGVSFRRQKGVTIVAPRAAGPAALAGLLYGDKLEKLEGRDVQQLRLWELHETLSSAQGQATLTVRRGGSVDSIVVTTESLDTSHGVEVEWPAPGLLLLRPPPLTDETLKECADALVTHWRARSVRGVILDLRDNPGGSLTSAVGHASIFLRSNSLVATLRSNASIPNNMRLRATPEFYVHRSTSDPLASLPAATKTVPLAVLADESTSSGAEMIAAAIQFHGRGVVVGRQTSGVASIQTFSALPNGGVIKYTSAYWEPPTGQQVNDIGVRPDRVVTATDPRAAVAVAIQALASPTTN
jgi:carboxyl-terminal processing protease